MYSLIVKNIYLSKLSAGGRRCQIAEQDAGHIGYKCLPELKSVTACLANKIKDERIDQIIDEHDQSHNSKDKGLCGLNSLKHRTYLLTDGKIQSKTPYRKDEHEIQNVFSGSLKLVHIPRQLNANIFCEILYPRTDIFLPSAPGIFIHPPMKLFLIFL